MLGQCWWVGEIGSRWPPENKEGAAGRFPFVANHDKQGLVMSQHLMPLWALPTDLGGTSDEFTAIPQSLSASPHTASTSACGAHAQLATGVVGGGMVGRLHTCEWLPN